MQTVIDKGRECAKAYQFNFKGEISSLGTKLTLEIRNMCAQIVVRVDIVRQDVSDLGGGPFLQ